MKEVLEFIQQKKQDFAKLQLFAYMQDNNINPLQRVAWAPCLAPFAMHFKDLNAMALRQEPATNSIQEMINKHTYEDGRHWAWYLSDIESLSIDIPMRFTDVLRFLWGKETEKTRGLCQDLYALCKLEQDPIIKLTVIECIEVTGTVALAALCKLGQDLEKVTQKRFRYLSAYHLGVETGHVQGGLSYNETDDFLHTIQLTEEQKEKCLKCVETVFKGFSECMDEFMLYAESHTIEQPFSKSHVSQSELAAAFT
jgi:hypothetical protein